MVRVSVARQMSSSNKPLYGTITYHQKRMKPLPSFAWPRPVNRSWQRACASAVIGPSCCSCRPDTAPSGCVRSSHALWSASSSTHASTSPEPPMHRAHSRHESLLKRILYNLLETCSAPYSQPAPTRLQNSSTSALPDHSSSAPPALSAPPCWSAARRFAPRIARHPAIM